jgi:Transposase IS4
MRLDEREIAGASERIEDAPDLLEVRTSKRGRVPKRQWPEVEVSKPRKKRRIPALPTPESTQNSTQTATETSTSTFTIHEDKPATTCTESSQSQLPTRKRTKEKHHWEVEYEALKKNKSTQAARDYLVRLIGNDEYPEVLKVPVTPPEVLLDCPFNTDDPLAVWRRFISEEDLCYIAKHTNEQAHADRIKQRLQRPQPQRYKRPWKKVTSTEIGGYFGALFLLGTQGAASLVDNWKTSEDSPLYPIRRFISLVRFQQISRYLKINRPSKANDTLKDTEFWLKVEPLASSFRDKCRANLRPGTVFAIDEQLRRNRGRWKHALQISSKADSKGVKIYSLCTGYYCYDFLFASKIVGVPEVRKFVPKDPTMKPFSTSESVVLTLIEQLQQQYPNEALHLTLACDNFFTTHKLFAELKARGIAAYGTAKAGSGMPAQQVLLRECTDKATDYGLLCNSVYGDVNHVTFVDQKAVHMMTTTYDVKNEEFAWRDAATRRNACLDRAREKAGRTELPYPQLSHDYNQGMNSCDVASQVWSYYSVARYSHWRNWWPMLWLILDASIANVLYLYRLKGYTESDLSHRQLQTTIALQLLGQPASVLRKRESDVIVLGQKPSAIKKELHRWIKPGTRGYCEWCKGPTDRRGRPPGTTRTPLQELSKNTRPPRIRYGHRTSFKCEECNVWLCHDSYCWEQHHAANTNTNANSEDAENGICTS